MSLRRSTIPIPPAAAYMNRHRPPVRQMRPTRTTRFHFEYDKEKEFAKRDTNYTFFDDEDDDDDDVFHDEEDVMTTDGRDLSPTPTPTSTSDSGWIGNSMSKPREVLFVMIVCMSQFTVQTGYMGTLILLRTIGATFNIWNPAQLDWMVAGYSLTVGTFILFSGRLGDVFGYKRVLLFGTVWFSVWSAVVGASVYTNFTVAIVSRVLQGIGPALCLPNALAILGAAYPPGNKKAMMFAFFGATAPIGAVIGCVFFSLLSLAWWPWAYWAMAIGLAVLAVATVLIVPNVPQTEPYPKNFRGWVETLDLPGAIVGVVALVLFNFAWTQAPISGWQSPIILAPLAAGLVLFVIFGLIESRLSPRPLLPFSAVNADVAFVLATVGLGWATFGVWTLYLTQILQYIRQLSPLLISAYFAPVLISGACAAVFTGFLLGKLKVAPPKVMVMALIAFTIGVCLTAFAPKHQVYWAQIFVSVIVMPFGMDMSFPAATLILSDAVPKAHQGVAASLVNTVVNYGIALGVGFASTVDVHVNGNAITDDEWLQGFRGALYFGIGLSGLGLVVSLMFLLRWRSRSRKT